MSEGCISTNYRVCEMCLRMIFDAKKELPMLNTTALHKFLEDRATPTPFLYSYLMKLSKKKTTFKICAHCDSWLRRQCTTLKMSRGGAQRSFLLVDRFILSIMLPGQYAPPEMRISQRLIDIIRKDNGNNWLASICPPLVVRTACDNIIIMSSRKVLKGITVAVWKSDRRQTVFSNGLYAKFIRCVGPDD